MTLHVLYDGPHAPGFAHWAAPAGADCRNVRQNPHCQLFDGVESFEIIAQSIGGERGQPESHIGGLLRELIYFAHLLSLAVMVVQSDGQVRTQVQVRTTLLLSHRAPPNSPVALDLMAWLERSSKTPREQATKVTLPELMCA